MEIAHRRTPIVSEILLKGWTRLDLQSRKYLISFTYISLISNSGWVRQITHSFFSSKNIFTWWDSKSHSIFAINSCLKKFEDKDPKQIVIDEVIGQSIPIYLYEISHGIEKDFDKSILFYFFIFVLFRIFDILKPFPINYFDRKYKNTFGIMFDDILAGFYVVLTLILAMIVKNLL